MPLIYEPKGRARGWLIGWTTWREDAKSEIHRRPR